MTFSLNFTHLVQAVVTDANEATTVFGKINTYVQVAEQVGQAWGLKGADKLTLVKNMLLADLGQVNPALEATVSANWSKIAAVVSVMIQVFNTIGWMFEAAAPIIIAAAPGAATAISAINAAIEAAKQVGAAASGQTTAPATA